MPQVKINVDNYDEAIKDLQELPKSWDWTLPQTNAEECFKTLYSFEKKCKEKDKDFNLARKLPQLKFYISGVGLTSLCNVGGETKHTYLYYLVDAYGNHGDTEPPWQHIHDILEIVEKKEKGKEKEGVDFCSLVRGWDHNVGKAKAQGEQILESLVEQYTEQEIIQDPIKRNIVRMLSNESLYEKPSSSTNPNTQYSYEQHKKLVAKRDDECSPTELKIRKVQERVKNICVIAAGNADLEQDLAEQDLGLQQAILNQGNVNKSEQNNRPETLPSTGEVTYDGPASTVEITVVDRSESPSNFDKGSASNILSSRSSRSSSQESWVDLDGSELVEAGEMSVTSNNQQVPVYVSGADSKVQQVLANSLTPVGGHSATGTPKPIPLPRKNPPGKTSGPVR